MPPVRGSPFPPHTGSHLHPGAAARPFSRRLPPQPPPGCYFKHANLGDHLPAPKFSEKTKACEPAGLRFPAALGGLRAALGRCFQPGLAGSWRQDLRMSFQTSAWPLSAARAAGELRPGRGGWLVCGTARRVGRGRANEQGNRGAHRSCPRRSRRAVRGGARPAGFKGSGCVFIYLFIFLQ